MYIFVKGGLIMKCRKECLLLIIEHFRKKLIEVGTSEGYNNTKTILLSQKLDKVILKYQKLNK
ncbi:aspartyl-phosphate phosphatase Spo0E family protein [Bacillus sp. ISL-45]|uniref:aspartyl-phosphate phosphatase Spo0E family protein n=1 Tax=Bacillus sp. ISL-45 TaxID=2819128 RepID=UPI003338000F